MTPRYTVEHDAEDARFPWSVVDTTPEGYPRESHIIAGCYAESRARAIADALNAVPVAVDDALVPKPGHEVRRNEDGTPDEVVGFGFMHLEQMDNGAWWIGFDTEDGLLLHVNLWTTRNTKIHARAEKVSSSDLWARRFRAVERRASGPDAAPGDPQRASVPS